MLRSFGFKLSIVKCVLMSQLFSVWPLGRDPDFAFFGIGTCTASKPFTLSTSAMPSIFLFIRVGIPTQVLFL